MSNTQGLGGARIALFGVPKCGKTTTAAACVLGVGAAFAAPGALLPVQTFLACDLPQVREGQFGDVPKFIDEAAKRVDSWPIIYIDDMSLLINDWVTKNSSGANGWAGIRAAEGMILRMQEASERYFKAGGVLVATFHERPTKMVSGKKIRGGPDAPGQLPEKIVPKFDVVLRAEYDATQEPHPWIVRSKGHGDWVTGDRLSIFPDGGPMNIAEGLRCRGYNIPRPESMAKYESGVEALAQEISKNPESYKSLLKAKLEKLLGMGLRAEHARILLEDALHRSIYRRERRMFDWLDGNGPAADGVL